MGRRNLITFAAFVLFAIAGVKAGTVWESKPFNTWTDAELNGLLTGSPWAGPGSIVRIKPDGSTAKMGDNVTVSWTTALPMRQAVARERIGLNGPVTKDVESFLTAPVQAFVVAVKVTGSPEAGALAALAGEAQTMTRLAPRDKPVIVALHGEGYALDAAGKLVAVAPSSAGATPGAQPAAAGGSLLIFTFSRGAISARDREVEFSSQLGNFAVKRTFHVNDMIYNGKLEL